MHATYPTHLILLYFITLIICGELYKLCSFSLCVLLQPPATLSLLLPYILLSTHRVQNGSGAHPASYPVGAMGSFPRDKAAEV
jgi:hypothetical protein